MVRKKKVYNVGTVRIIAGGVFMNAKKRRTDDEIKSGTEIYSRLFKISEKEEFNNVINTYLPETSPNEDNKTPLYTFLIDRC